MLPSVRPAFLSSKSQNAWKTLGGVIGDDIKPRVLAVETKNNYIFVAKYLTDSENLHFQVFNKKCSRTDAFVLSGNKDGNNTLVKKYSAFQNNVMRRRDPLVSPDKDMTFEQTLQTRPIIVKRIETLLNAVAEALTKDG